MRLIHSCAAKCKRCRVKFAVCRGESHIPMYARPWTMFCDTCARLQIELWLNGQAMRGAPCPFCWSLSYCEGKTYVNEDRQVLCLQCSNIWPSLMAQGGPK